MCAAFVDDVQCYCADLLHLSMHDNGKRQEGSFPEPRREFNIHASVAFDLGLRARGMPSNPLPDYVGFALMNSRCLDGHERSQS